MNSDQPKWRISSKIKVAEPKKVNLVLSLEGKNLKQIPPLDTTKNWTTLDYSNNPIKSLRGLTTVPSVKILKLDKTMIENFEGFEREQTAEALFLPKKPSKNSVNKEKNLDNVSEEKSVTSINNSTGCNL